MKKRLHWLILFQLVALLLGFLFFRSVRAELEPALIRQGVENGRNSFAEDLREANVAIPENLDVRLPNKDIVIAPGLISLGQNLMLALPAAILQILALGLSMSCLGSTGGVEGLGQLRLTKNAEAGDGDA
jgi:hypothetical protein